MKKNGIERICCSEITWHTIHFLRFCHITLHYILYTSYFPIMHTRSHMTDQTRFTRIEKKNEISFWRQIGDFERMKRSHEKNGLSTWPTVLKLSILTNGIRVLFIEINHRNANDLNSEKEEENTWKFANMYVSFSLGRLVLRSKLPTANRIHNWKCNKLIEFEFAMQRQ